jgi:hypothetical protein
MKKLIITFLLLLITTTAMAADWSWNTKDTLLEAAAIGMTVVDWGQTRDIRNHNGRKELNPILGPHPSNAEVNRYFGIVTALHPLISLALPKKCELLGVELNPRLAWQYIYIGVEATAISSNWRGGLKLSF